MTEYLVRLAQEKRQWIQAEGLQIQRVDWARPRAALALALPIEELKSEERHAIRTLAASLNELGDIRRELGKLECIPAYVESLDLLERICERVGAAVCAFNLGNAFLMLSTVRDLGQAERWYQKSLELVDERDRLGQGRLYAQLGQVAYERFNAAQSAGLPEEELLRCLNASISLHHRSLALLPPDAVASLTTVHNHLGTIYCRVGDLNRGLLHYRQSIQLAEGSGDLYNAAMNRFNVALYLLKASRREDALAYAEAALRGYESYGDRVAEDIEKTHRLIEIIRGE